jgi:hypothetical protein
MNSLIERQVAYDEGYEAGKISAYEELIELFKDIPMWGAVAAYKIEKLKEKK